MDDGPTVILICAILFIGLPWLVFHYVTQWKRSGGITKEDEKALDEMFELGRRLEDRLTTIERIVEADHPGYRQGRRAEQEMLDRPLPSADLGAAAREPARRPTF